MRSNILLAASAIILGTIAVGIFFMNSWTSNQYGYVSPLPDLLTEKQTSPPPTDTAFAVGLSTTTVDANTNTTATAASASIAGIPLQIVIPAINVSANVSPAGVTADGAMAVPAGPTSTTWFDLGARPGEIGSAVIAGHKGWKDGIFATFDDLYKLQPGDKVYIEDDQGSTLAFVVRAVQLFDQNASAATVFNSNDGKAHLNLITCEGTWNATQKSYSDRLVVFTDEEL